MVFFCVLYKHTNNFAGLRTWVHSVETFRYRTAQCVITLYVCVAVIRRWKACMSGVRAAAMEDTLTTWNNGLHWSPTARLVVDTSANSRDHFVTFIVSVRVKTSGGKTSSMTYECPRVLRPPPGNDQDLLASWEMPVYVWLTTSVLQLKKTVIKTKEQFILFIINNNLHYYYEYTVAAIDL